MGLVEAAIFVVQDAEVAEGDGQQTQVADRLQDGDGALVPVTGLGGFAALLVHQGRVGGEIPSVRRSPAAAEMASAGS